MKPQITAMLVAPAAALMFGIFVLPFLFLLVLSFWSQVPGSLGFDTSFTFANYIRIFGDSYYLGGLWTTLWLSSLVTLICLVLALPLSRFIVRRAGPAKGLIIGLSILPLVCGALLPTLGLVNLLSPLGFINGALKSMGLIQSSLPLLGNITGVTIGLVQAFLPLMVLPLITTLERLPQDYEKAAMSLGARRIIVWQRILLPLLLPGIVAGSLLVFCASLTAFVTPQVLGQGKVVTFASLAYQQAALVLDWPFASALAIVLIFLALAGLLGAVVSRNFGMSRMRSRLTDTLSLVVVLAILLFILAPILVLIFSAFDGGNIFRFPPRSYSLRWFEAAFNHPEYRSSLWISTLLGVISTLIAVTLASFAAFGLVRGRPRYGLALEVLLLAPLTLPLVVWAIALLSIYAELGMNGTLPGLILAHVTITLPFAARIMIATFKEIDPRLEAAAKSLGAPPSKVLRRIILPLALPGLLSSTAIAFLVSFNDVVVTTLIAGAGWITFPVRTFSRLRTEGIDPTTIAIGAMIVAFTIGLIVVGQRLFQLSRRL